ncbi:glycoside hydrolase [Schizophyllum commune H4-8]|nr:glycoside hydrolase [Schizophyllum commune H4-8]KAI5900253.1 glycoside hydrolase [Schizophyllum commune H4-8]
MLSLCTHKRAQLSPQIPSVAEFTASDSGGTFSITSDLQILVDENFADELTDYAATFREDLIWITNFTDLPVVTVAPNADGGDQSVVFLTIGDSNHTLYNGDSTLEGYDFEITDTVYTISGSGTLGTWWGTRTLLQQAVLSASGDSDALLIPTGSGSDSPGWEVRGFMLDVARHYFETSFVADMCVYASFFKLQTLHLHVSDFIYNDPHLHTVGDAWKEDYAAFRLQPSEGSPIAGLVVGMENETWSYDDFTALQDTCTAHGVTLIPEIDTPGHSLVFTKWKPELAIPLAPDFLNLSLPESTAIVKAAWDEVLPWFTASEVSIGADEYDSSLADDYIAFVNDMASYIANQSKKGTRIWGTYEPSDTSSVSKDVTIQHWNFPGDSIPVQLMDQGYPVINSEQRFLYMVGKYSPYFPYELDQDLLWGSAPDGGGWAPNIFSADDQTNNTSVDNPLLRGSIMALWNDYGNNASTPLDVYFQVAKSIATFAEKAWAGSRVRDTELTQEQFEQVYPILEAKAPGQNLSRAVRGAAPGSTLVNYTALDDVPTNTSYPSVGPPYTLTFTITPDADNGTIFAGTDTALLVSSLAFQDIATNQFYPIDYTLPLGEPTTVQIRATRLYTVAEIGGVSYLYQTTMGISGNSLHVANMSFAAPAQTIGSEGVLLEDVSLVLG